jgi:hypothetical protein
MRLMYPSRMSRSPIAVICTSRSLMPAFGGVGLPMIAGAYSSSSAVFFTEEPEDVASSEVIDALVVVEARVARFRTLLRSPKVVRERA